MKRILLFALVLTVFIGCERAADPVDYMPVISCEAAYITLRPEPVKEPPKGDIGPISDVTSLSVDICDKYDKMACFAPKSGVSEQKSGEKGAVLPSDVSTAPIRRPAWRIFRRR
jgi:hypothetical protein